MKAGAKPLEVELDSSGYRKPRHTWSKFDCRPSKARLHVVIDDFALREIPVDVAAARILVIASSITTLEHELFADYLGKLLGTGRILSARRTIDGLDDFVIRDRAAVLLVLIAVLVAAGLLAAVLRVSA